MVDRLTEGWAPEQIAARHGLLAMAAWQLDRAAFWRAMAEGVDRRGKRTPSWSGPLGPDGNQAAVLTGGRVLCASNCSGLR